jgi:hypothetical protein
MRNLLALLGAGTVTFVGLGWYLDWYKIERKPSPAAGTQRLEVEVNGQKIGADVVAGSKRVGEFIEKLSENNSAPSTSKPADDGKVNGEKPPSTSSGN